MIGSPARVTMHLRDENYTDDVGFQLRTKERFSDDKTKVANLVQFVERSEHQGATVLMAREDAARLMDSLWGLGIRPTEEPTRGVIAAMKEHIADLQSVVRRLMDGPDQ